MECLWCHEDFPMSQMVCGIAGTRGGLCGKCGEGIEVREPGQVLETYIVHRCGVAGPGGPVLAPPGKDCREHPASCNCGGFWYQREDWDEYAEARMRKHRG